MLVTFPMYSKDIHYPYVSGDPLVQYLPESRQIDQCTWDMPISAKNPSNIKTYPNPSATTIPQFITGWTNKFHGKTGDFIYPPLNMPKKHGKSPFQVVNPTKIGNFQ